MEKKFLATFICALMTAPSAYAYDLNVSSGSMNAVIAQSKSYTIPKGTKSIVVVYDVYSAEYPKWVSEQSVYNDVWSLSLSGPDGVLYNIIRQVNSQLYMEPTWLPNSTTGEITKTIDVASLTKNGPVNLELNATSMNVGDSQLQTVVSAMLAKPASLEITDTTADAITTTNVGNHYSIPAQGAGNTLHRYFTLKLSKSEDVSLKDVTVNVGGTADLMTVMNQKEIPNENDAKIVSETATDVTLKVRVTVSDPVSTVNGTPPPTRDLQYTFAVTGEDTDKNSVSAEKVVTGRRALWRMASVFPKGRYGSRDEGGDDWGAQGTYAWIQTNRHLLNEIDDISGEHGRNIGHDTHQYGTDIDMYHFHRLPGAISGTDNYNRLRNTAVTAFGVFAADGSMLPNPPAAAVSARNELAAFVGATRIGLDNLAAVNTVLRIYYAIGTAGSGLPNGWARDLLQSGRLTRTVTTATGTVTQTLDVVGTTWDNETSKQKMAYNAIHNTHVHITLNRPLIGD